MSSALAFLKHILPAEGYKCATVITETKKYNRFFTSCEELAHFISTEDALGRTVYHACASFKTNESRKASNVLCAKTLWLDVDAGEGKPYADACAAYQAVNSFRRRLALPAPTYISSGYGLHVYLPLDEAVDLDTWKILAAKLKQLCHQERLEVDEHRTCDASSILRTPGTRNRKHGGAEIVTVGELTGPYRLDELGALNVGLSILRREEVASPSPRLSDVARPASLCRISEAAGNLYTDEPVNVHAIADGCAQLGELRGRLGKIPEPNWYACLGVLAEAGADAIAHEWSSGHPTYSRHETQNRLGRAREFGPTTCAKFESVNAKGCEGCPHKGKITSPIQLGRGRLGCVAPPTPQQLHEFCGFPTAPQDFILDQTGLWHLSERDDKNKIRILVSSAPIYLESIQTGEITAESFSLCFKLHLPNEPVKDLTVPAKTFFSSHGMSELHGRGAVIHEPDVFRKYVREAMDAWHTDNKLEMRYDQFGWKHDDNAFLCGQRLYTARNIEPTVGSDEIKTRSQYLGPTRTGSISAWSNAANSLFAVGCEPQSFALLSSFAAPLMRFHSTGEGGAIVSLVSDQSGSGKTTALEAVASVWGRLKGVQLTDDDTKVSKGLTLGVLGNLPCVYDELYDRDPEVIRKFVLMFTNGRDKMRGTVDGQLRHSKAEWQTLLVLASNKSIVDMLSTMDGTDAPAFRLLEFITEFPTSLEKRGDELKRILAANSGFAGDAYLRALLQPETLSYVKTALPEWTDKIWQRSGLRNEHRFWVRTLASVVAAGVLVRHVGILDFSIQRILDWAISECQARADDATVTGKRDAQSALADFFHTHINDTLVVQDEWKPHTAIRPLVTPKRDLHVRFELNPQRAFITETVLRKWLVTKGVNRAAFMKELKARDILLHDKKRVTLGAGTDFASGQVTVLEINMKHPAVSGVVASVTEMVQKPAAPLRAKRLKS